MKIQFVRCLFQTMYCPRMDVTMRSSSSANAVGSVLCLSEQQTAGITTTQTEQYQIGHVGTGIGILISVKVQCLITVIVNDP